jgi:transcriptional regulator with XRE-family HTH domain
MDKKLLKLFGQRIRQIRMLKKLSQEQLAVIADLHRTYIGMIERGEKNITLLNIEKLSNALAIEIQELFIFDNKDA